MQGFLEGGIRVFSFCATSFLDLSPSVLLSLVRVGVLALLGLHKRLDLKLGWLWRLGFFTLGLALGGIAGSRWFCFVGWFLRHGFACVGPPPLLLHVPAPFFDFVDVFFIEKC